MTMNTVAMIKAVIVEEVETSWVIAVVVVEAVEAAVVTKVTETVAETHTAAVTVEVVEVVVPKGTRNLKRMQINTSATRKGFRD